MFSFFNLKFIQQNVYGQCKGRERTRNLVLVKCQSLLCQNRTCHKTLEIFLAISNFLVQPNSESLSQPFANTNIILFFIQNDLGYCSFLKLNFCQGMFCANCENGHKKYCSPNDPHSSPIPLCLI